MRLILPFLMVGTFRSGRLYGISAISRFFKRNVRKLIKIPALSGDFLSLLKFVIFIPNLLRLVNDTHDFRR